MYNTLEEKSDVFNRVTVDSREELITIVSNISGNDNNRYRGVNEAKYTMLTSIQRFYQNIKINVSQNEYISQLLYRVKSDSDVKNYFNKQNIPINDISCMALMQHQGLPTPMLDFSTDINIALSFAEDGMNMASSSNKIDDYVSLYVIDLSVETEVAASVQQIYQRGMVSGKLMLNEFRQENPNTPVNASILYDMDRFIKWKDISGFSLSFIEYQQKAPGVVTLSGQQLDLTNPNLVKQKGCFVLNLHNESMPMEDNWNMRTLSSRNQIWSSGAQKLPFSGVHTYEKMRCYDIKKVVMEEWAQRNKVELYDNSTENKAIKQKLHDIQDDIQDELTKDLTHSRG